MADEPNPDARPTGIDPMLAGLAHEGRNALQATQACVERLRWRVQGQTELLALLAEIEKAQDALHGLFDDIRACAAPPRLEPWPCDLAAVWRAAWTQALGRHPGRDARLAEVPCETDGDCVADSLRLGLAFRKVFERALAGCPDPVVVTVACSEAVLARGPAVRVAVRDNGPGGPREGGFGMTIAERVVQAHGGELAAGAHGGPGAEVSITLPRSLT